MIFACGMAKTSFNLRIFKYIYVKVFLYRLLFLCTNFFIISLISLPPAISQESENNTLLQERAVRVFLDVPRQYQEYIKTEIPFVNYMRDRKQAQVYIMLTTQKTGSGGTEHTITFIVQQNFAAVSDTLKYVSQQMDSEEIIRNGIVRTLKLGLVPYVAKTPFFDFLNVTYDGITDPTTVLDKWNYWVFNINTNSRLNGEESRKSLTLRGSVSADRVTPYWKTSLNVSAEYDERTYETDEGTVSSYTRAQDFRGLVVKSLGEHWSSGFFGSANSSTYRNTEFSWNVAPAVEYNVFPYSESTRREFQFLYRVGYTNIRYNEETIFDKMQEGLFNESLSATYEIKEKWGSVRSTLEGSHYFFDINKNRLELNCNLNLRLFEGFSLDLFGNVSRIHDQLSLPKTDATEEEILLNRRQLSTQYDYFASIGLRYTFGSIYSNVVNPRFGSGERHDFGDHD